MVSAPAVAELRIRNMPENVRRELKLWSVEEGKFLNNLVIQLLAQAVENRRHPPHNQKRRGKG